MKIIIYATLLIGAMLAAILYLGERRSQKGGTSAYHRISAEEAKKEMENTAEFILLDVRTQDEFFEQHIPGAVLIPDFQIAAQVEKTLPNKDTPLFVYCRSGRRSAGAAKQLVRMGYTQVYDFGGILNWPYETTSGSETVSP